MWRQTVIIGGSVTKHLIRLFQFDLAVSNRGIQFLHVKRATKLETFSITVEGIIQETKII